MKKLLFVRKRKLITIPVFFIIIGVLLLFFIPTGIAWIIGADTQQAIREELSSVQVQKVSAVPTREAKDTREQARFLRVVDGDTIEVSLNGTKQKVRIIGINTPEIVDPRRPIECLGEEASQHAKVYFESTDKKLWLEADSTQGDKDKYERLLRFVFTDDGKVDYGKLTIGMGYANEYTYNTPYKYQDIYKQAEKEAREGKKGLWADDACADYIRTDKKTVTNTSGGTTTSTSGDKDCSDFALYEEAQAYFLSKGGSTSNNVDRLDRDGDGFACED